MVSGQVQVCGGGCGSRCNTTCTVPKWGFFQDRETKYMGRPTHAHWDLWVLNPIISPIRAGYQTPEVHPVWSDPTRETISKVLDGTDVELMESRVPNFTGKVIEIYSIRTYFSNTRPIYKVLHQDILVQGWNGSDASASIYLSGGNKFRGTRKGWRKVRIL